ncbi:MAG: DUF4400 domain-containing protein [Acidiferrobacterales bacterium]
MADEHESELKLIRVVLVTAVLVFFLLVMLGPPSIMEHGIATQLSTIGSEMGSSAETAAHAAMNRWLNHCCVKSGLVAESFTWHFPRQARVFWEATRFSFLRLWLIGVWLPPLMPLVLGAAVDGWVRRRIRQWRFEFVSRARHWWARGGIMKSVGAGIAILFLPVPLPPFAVPVAWIIAIAAMRTWIATLQKRF